MATVTVVKHDVKVDGDYITLVMFLDDGKQIIISALSFEAVTKHITMYKPVSYTITGRHV